MYLVLFTTIPPSQPTACRGTNTRFVIGVVIVVIGVVIVVVIVVIGVVIVEQQRETREKHMNIMILSN